MAGARSGAGLGPLAGQQAVMCQNPGVELKPKKNPAIAGLSTLNVRPGLPRLDINFMCGSEPLACAAPENVRAPHVSPCIPVTRQRPNWLTALDPCPSGSQIFSIRRLSDLRTYNNPCAMDPIIDPLLAESHSDHALGDPDAAPAT